MEEENGEDAVDFPKLGAQVLKVLDAGALTVSLHNGNVVEGSFSSFLIRKKERKGEVSFSGKLSVETDSGVLEMDCSSIASVNSKE